MVELGRALMLLLALVHTPDISPEAAVFHADHQQPARNVQWDSLAECESTGRWDINTRNGYYGGIQFHPVSWRAVGGTGLPHEWSRLEQIYRGELLFTLQGAHAWPGCHKYKNKLPHWFLPLHGSHR